MKHILYMAPIRGVTGVVYRNEYSKLFKGYSYAITPFIETRTGDQSKKKTVRDVLPERNTAKFKIVPQILSNDAKGFIQLAKTFFDFGYEYVNWNLGCPLQKVARKKRGSGLLGYPDDIVKFLDEVIPNIPNKVSVKVRLGREESDDLFSLLPLLKNIPLHKIMIHARTAKQMYTGSPDLEAFMHCLTLTSHSIVYNGDIDSIDTFTRLTQQFPQVHEWMIGRGGITNPFLPEQIISNKEYSYKEKIAKFQSFHDAIFISLQNELSGPAHLMDKIKELWCYWANAFENGDRFFRKISRAKSPSLYRSAVADFLKDSPRVLI